MQLTIGSRRMSTTNTRTTKSSDQVSTRRMSWTLMLGISTSYQHRTRKKRCSTKLTKKKMISTTSKKKMEKATKKPEITTDKWAIIVFPRRNITEGCYPKPFLIL